MNVILDVEAIAYPLTGIGRYTLALAKGLELSPQVGDVKFFTAGRWIDNLDDLGIDNSGHKESKFVLSKATLRQKIPFRRLARWIYGHLSAWRFHQQVKKLTGYVYHGPNYRLLPYSASGSVVTIHDLSFIRHPEFHPKERADFWQAEIHEVVKRASHIITDSEFQRKEIVELLDVEAEKVTAVHLGVEDKFQPFSADRSKIVLDKYGLRYKEYSLVVATLEPRKNFVRLIQAFEQMPAKIRKAYPLAIVGDKGWLSDDIHRTISSLMKENEAVKLGYVDEEDLPQLYSSASVFLYPSLYEGFGLPVLEAMASGTAVLTSNSTSIPEVAGSACLLVDPYSVDEIFKGWISLLEDKELRERLGNEGRLRARKFSWQRCVEETINAYEKLDY